MASTSSLTLSQALLAKAISHHHAADLPGPTSVA
jgi:transketolase